MTKTTGQSTDFESATFAKIGARLIPLLFAGYVVAFLDRVNVGFAKLEMASALHFSDTVYGFGAGIFFIGYFLFELPSNLILSRVGARLWMARIMITWGLISAAFLFTGTVRWGGLAETFGCTDAEFTFYVLRFLLGLAEAGFFPGIILYLAFWFPSERRAHMIALFMSAIAVSNIVGSPISGAILQFTDGALALRGWQWLFIIEAMPSIVVGLIMLAELPDSPTCARWLSSDERRLVEHKLAADDLTIRALAHRETLFGAFKDYRLWLLTLIQFCGVVCFYGVNFWLPTLVQEVGIAKSDYFKVGLLSMIPWSAMAIAQIVWARHSDKTGERRWHCAAALLMMMLGLSMLAFVGHEPVLSLLALSLTLIGFGSWTVTFWTLPTAFLSGTAAAAGIAWINSVGNLGGQVGPDLIGRIREASGGDAKAAFLALSASALIGAVVTLLTPGIQAKDAAS